jgi:hypothetical protein
MMVRVVQYTTYYTIHSKLILLDPTRTCSVTFFIIIHVHFYPITIL